MAASKSRWSWWMILLWAYSVLLIIVAMVGGMFPSTTPTTQTDAYFGVLLFLPVLVFLVLVGKHHLKK